MRRLLPLLLLIGCGEATSTRSEISSEPLSGVIGGEAWAFVGGFVKRDGDGGRVAFLYEIPAEGCAAPPEAALGAPSLLIGLPEGVGSRAFSCSMDALFSFTAEGEVWALATIMGEVVVDLIEDGRLQGRARLVHDEENHVEGRFEVRLCDG